MGVYVEKVDMGGVEIVEEGRDFRGRSGVGGWEGGWELIGGGFGAIGRFRGRLCGALGG